MITAILKKSGAKLLAGSLLAVGLLALGAHTAQPVQAEVLQYDVGEVENSITASFIEESGSLTISGNGRMNDYSSSSKLRAPWYSQRSKITSIEVTKGVTSIGNYAFYGCDNVTSVTLGEGITSIGAYAFYGNSRLPEITFPTTLINIGSNAFFNCHELSTIVSLGAIESIEGNSFYSSGTDTIVCGDFGTYDWTDSKRIVHKSTEQFTAGTNVKAYYTEDKALCFIGTEAISDFSAGLTPWNHLLGSIDSVMFGDGITKIGSYALAGTSIHNAEIPDGITEIGTMAFGKCESLNQVTGGNGLTNIGKNAFLSETAVSTVINTKNAILSAYDWAGDGRTVLAIKEVYNFGNDITGFQLPGNVLLIQGIGEIPEKSSGSYAFKKEQFKALEIGYGITNVPENLMYGQTGLVKVTLPSSVESICEYAFKGCTGLSSVTLPSSLTTIGREAFSGCSALSSIDLDTGVLESIGEKAFYQCRSLSKVSVPSTVKKLPSQVFAECTALKEAKISNGVMELGSSVFSDCTALTKVSIPKSVSTVDSNGIFKRCSSLYTVTFASNARTIPDSICKGCTAITNLSIPSTVNSIGAYAFDGCTSLKEARLPAKCSIVGAYAFRGCTSLKKVTFRDSTVSIGSHAFESCEALTSVSLPDSLKRLGSSAFASCTSLSSVKLGSKLTEIPESCFYKTALKEVAIPFRVQKICSNAFKDIASLTSVTIGANTKTIDGFSQESLTIYGTAGSKAESYASEKHYEFKTTASKSTPEITMADKKSLLNGTSKSLRASVSTADFVDEIVWSSSDTSVLTVTKDSTDPLRAVITGKSIGSATVTVTIGSARQTCLVTVAGGVTSLTLAERTLRISESYELECKWTTSGDAAPELIWKSTNPKVATVDADGVIQPLSDGVTQISVMDKGKHCIAVCIVTVRMPK